MTLLMLSIIVDIVDVTPMVDIDVIDVDIVDVDIFNVDIIDIIHVNGVNAIDVVKNHHCC